MTRFNSQTGPEGYKIQFETDNKEHYEYVQEAIRRCVDDKLEPNGTCASCVHYEVCKHFFDTLGYSVTHARKHECKRFQGWHTEPPKDDKVVLIHDVYGMHYLATHVAGDQFKVVGRPIMTTAKKWMPLPKGE